MGGNASHKSFMFGCQKELKWKSCISASACCQVQCSKAMRYAATYRQCDPRQTGSERRWSVADAVQSDGKIQPSAHRWESTKRHSESTRNSFRGFRPAFFFRTAVVIFGAQTDDCGDAELLQRLHAILIWLRATKEMIVNFFQCCGCQRAEFSRRTPYFFSEARCVFVS